MLSTPWSICTVLAASDAWAHEVIKVMNDGYRKDVCHGTDIPGKVLSMNLFSVFVLNFLSLTSLC